MKTKEMIVSAGFAIVLAVAMPAAGFAESVGSLTSTGSSTALVESIEQDAEALDSDIGGSSVSTTGGGQVSNEDMGNAPVQNSALPESAQEPQTVTEGVEQDSGEIDYVEESASATGDEAIGYQLTAQPKNEAERQEASRPDGFEEVGGEVYYYEGGERVTGELPTGADPELGLPAGWRYFDPARGGAMVRSDFVLLDDADVNLDARDAALRGKKWVYYGEDGAMCYGFVYIAKPGTGPAKWVYYGETMGDGKMRYGEQNVGGSWYYLAPGSGAVSYGFVLLPRGALDGGRKWVYYGPYMGDGKMRKGEQYIDGGWYYLIPATGEVDYEWSYIPDKGKWVYYGPEMGDGRMRYGWQTIRGIRCHFNVYTGQVDNTGGVSFSSLTSSNLQRMVEVNYGFATNRGTASMSDLWKYIDPTNVKSGSAAYYQFADIRGYISSSYRGLSAAQINAYIDSSPKGRSGTLHNQGAAIVAAARRYNLNEVYLVSHMILESAWGTSSLARGDYWEAHTLNGIHYDSGVFYNYIGWGAFDNDPYKSGMNYAQMNGWTSPSAAIWGAAKLLHDNYIYRSTYGNQYTLYDMRWNPDYTLAHNVRSPHQYCTSVTWPTSIATLMSNCYKKAGVIPTLSYRVPRY